MLTDLEDFYDLMNQAPSAHSSDKEHLFLKAFHQISLEKHHLVSGKTDYFWVVLPATPEDMQELIR